jgi:hypothetical protein
MCSNTSFHLKDVSHPVQELVSPSQVLPHMTLYEKLETEVTYLRGETLSSTMVEPSSPSMPKWSFDFFCKYKHKNLSTSFDTIKELMKL